MPAANYKHFVKARENIVICYACKIAILQYTYALCCVCMLCQAKKSQNFTEDTNFLPTNNIMYQATKHLDTQYTITIYIYCCNLGKGNPGVFKNINPPGQGRDIHHFNAPRDTEKSFTDTVAVRVCNLLSNSHNVYSCFFQHAHY